MNTNTTDLEPRVAMNIVCLFLAQSDDPYPPHIELGFNTQNDAFKIIANIFKSNHHTVKLTRDAFDNHTDSARVGWKEPLRAELKAILDDYSDYDRDKLLSISQEILNQHKGKNLDNFFDRIETSDAKVKIQRPLPGVSILFSNSSNPPKWFALTIKQVISVLEDIRDNIDDFGERGAEDYVEKTWRDLMSANVQDDVANALSTVQTMPMFTLLSKIVHVANFDEEYKEKYFDLDADLINNAIAKLKSYSNLRLEEEVSKGRRANQDTTTDDPRITGGENEIYYGAPGTGKSYTVEKEIDENRTVRTVFHPDTQNSDFIGALKPVIQDGDVSYQFSPGPFARAMAAAYADPSNMHYLVIEELNRAPAAAVFGELFLMLDRKDDGTGEYDVDFPSNEFANWWKAETGNDTHKMRLPSNLSILATMNSADQGVYPLDTAFRRRWTQKYISINYTKAPTGHIKLALSASSEKEIEWADFIRRLNEFLISETSLAISEDRLIGPWFLKASELNDVLPGKLLIYLWDDLLRHQGRDIIFHSSIKTYGDLALTVEKKKLVFSKSFLEGFPQEQEQAE